MKAPLGGSGKPGAWSGRELNVNADFDLNLRHRRTGRARSGSERQIRELPLHLLLMGGREDSVRADTPMPGDLAEALGGLGFELPRVTVRPAVRRDALLTPFGWNEETARLNRRYDRPAPHPPLDVVRRVNGRSFLAGIEAEVGDGAVVAESFRSISRLERFLARTPPPARGWVAKAEHGNAALGNRRLRTGRLTEADQRFLARLFAEDEGVLLEPWLDRCGDLSATFEVDPDGGAACLEVHEVVNTAEGAFIGARFGGDGVAERWQAEMERVSGLVARWLAAVGYHGPVCLDGILWRDRGTTRIRPMVDLNARLHVSLAALRVWTGWGRDRVVFWRLFSRRKLLLPDTFGELARALGRDAFDPASRIGTVVTSPLWIDESGRRRRPLRLGVLFAATSRADTVTLERRFREAFE